MSSPTTATRCRVKSASAAHAPHPEALFREAETAFVQGDLRRTAELCQAIIQDSATFAPAYYLTAELFRKTHNHAKALEFIDRALALAPDASVFHTARGHALTALSRPEAADAYAQALHLDAGNLPARLALIDAALIRHDFTAAQASIDAAPQDAPELAERRVRCLRLRGDISAARAACEALTERWPSYAPGHLAKGDLLFDVNEFDAAGAAYARALVADQRSEVALCRLASVQKMRGQAQEAVDLTVQAIRLNPRSVMAHLLLGILYYEAGRHAEAETAYKTVLEIEPLHARALIDLINILMLQQKSDEAKRYIEQGLKHAPDNDLLRYFQAMVAGGRVEKAPREYVAKLFDSYADHFDRHLMQTLGCQIPSMLAAALQNVRRPEAGMQLLDLGCGTGQMARALNIAGITITGIDLSPKMLEKARLTGLYQELHAADVVEFMQASAAAYDIITAADVFIYLGDLHPVIAAARQALKQNGLLAFSVESAEVEDYRLQPNGRYQYSETYIRSLADAYGFALELLDAGVLRFERKQPVHGLFAVMRKLPLQ